MLRHSAVEGADYSPEAEANGLSLMSNPRPPLCCVSLCIEIVEFSRVRWKTTGRMRGRGMRQRVRAPAGALRRNELDAEIRKLEQRMYLKQCEGWPARNSSEALTRRAEASCALTYRSGLPVPALLPSISSKRPAYGMSSENLVLLPVRSESELGDIGGIHRSLRSIPWAEYNVVIVTLFLLTCNLTVTWALKLSFENLKLQL